MTGEVESESASGGILDRITNLRSFVVLVALYLVFPLYLFPNSAYESDVGPLDLKFSYTPEEAHATLGAFGEEGRARYARAAFTLDLAYPIVYTLLFIVWLRLVTREALSGSCAYLALTFSPLSVFVFDLLENTGIVLLITRFSDEPDPFARFVSVATSVKWISAAAVILLTLASTAYWGWRRISKRRDG